MCCQINYLSELVACRTYDNGALSSCFVFSNMGIKVGYYPIADTRTSVAQCTQGTSMPTGRKFLNELGSDSTLFCQELDRMTSTLFSCVDDCGLKQTDIHSSRCSVKVLAHWYWAGKLCWPLFPMCISTLWAMHLQFRFSGSKSLTQSLSILLHSQCQAATTVFETGGDRL